MSENQSETSFSMPEPHPSLKSLQPLVGTWRLKGHLTGSDEENITGQTTFSWLQGGFFLQQDAHINFMGMDIQSREIIGYDAQSETLKSSVYSNLSPVALPYEWDVDGDVVTIRVKYGPFDATFTGNLTSFSGGWVPNPGADPAANVAYDIVSERVHE